MAPTNSEIELPLLAGEPLTPERDRALYDMSAASDMRMYEDTFPQEIEDMYHDWLERIDIDSPETE